jgi:hypothetical protein
MSIIYYIFKKLEERISKVFNIKNYKSFFFTKKDRLELRAYTLSHTTSYPLLLVKGFFWDRVSWTIFLGWLLTTILLISASWVARIIDVNPSAHLYKSFIIIIVFLYWEYIVTFTKLLTIHHSPLALSPIKRDKSLRR